MMPLKLQQSLQRNMLITSVWCIYATQWCKILRQRWIQSCTVLHTILMILIKMSFLEQEAGTILPPNMTVAKTIMGGTSINLCSFGSSSASTAS